MRKLMFFMLLLSGVLVAQTQEEIVQQIKNYSNNIGFTQGEKRIMLKEQFSMCDTFLDVHWFEKKPNTLQRGWRKYTTAFDDKYDSNLAQYVKKEEDTTVYELVEIQEDGHAEYYGLYFIQRAFPDNWKEVIQDVKITGNNQQFTFHYKSKKYEVSKFKFKMADNYLNICVATPDTQTALFYEMRRANKVLSDEEQDALVKKINDDGIKLAKEALDGFVPMDINYDGMVDLQSISRPGGYYSDQNIYFNVHRENYGVPEMKYIFPKNQICIVTLHRNYFYVYQKSLYFKDINYKNNTNICNLTQLTTLSQGEN